MLSYQHIYHAGNLADVHKHALLAWMLAYMTRKDKPLSYIETHAGRALYDLTSAEAVKTGEAAQGIDRLIDAFAPDHPYRQVIASVRADHGPTTYPGSPMIAAGLLRPSDKIHLAELHPQEAAGLQSAMALTSARVYTSDGFALAQSLTPPSPARGMLLIDPSYEIKSDYTTIPDFMRQIARKWAVGIQALWYPVLVSNAHTPMLRALERHFPEGLRHEVTFPPAKDGHRMIGSGMFIVNPPYGIETETTALSAMFAA